MMGSIPSPWLECIECGERHPLGELYACPKCEGELEVRYPLDSLRSQLTPETFASRPSSMWQRYRELMPVIDPAKIVSLGEGGTPLVRSRGVARHLGLSKLYFKLESCNPTGSFKDRQISGAVTAASQFGRRVIALASSGNAGAAAAAYAAAAGIEAHVWVHEEAPRPKVQQIMFYGAYVYVMSKDTPGEEQRKAYYEMGRLCSSRGWAPVVTARKVNPYVIEGGKTIAYEVCEQLGWRSPDYAFLPVGGGGCVLGNWKGYKEFLSLGLIKRLPRVIGTQKEGATRISTVDSLEESEQRFVPLDGRSAYRCIVESGGEALVVSPERITEAQLMIAELDGIFAEPQGATAAAGLLKAVEKGLLPRDATVVCYVTGSGLKDNATLSLAEGRAAAEGRLSFVEKFG